MMILDRTSVIYEKRGQLKVRDFDVSSKYGCSFELEDERDVDFGDNLITGRDSYGISTSSFHGDALWKFKLEMINSFHLEGKKYEYAIIVLNRWDGGDDFNTPEKEEFELFKIIALTSNGEELEFDPEEIDCTTKAFLRCFHNWDSRLTELEFMGKLLRGVNEAA